MDSPRFSAILLTYRRADYLRECLASLAAADRRDVEEIIVVVNGDDPEAEDIIAGWRGALPELRPLAFPRLSRGAARNQAAQRARGDVLYFLDDDAHVAPDIFAKATALYRERPAAWAVGGPNLTPASDSVFQRAVGGVLSSRFGAWSMSRRYRASGHARFEDDKSLMLCNLSVRREAFTRLGLRFDEQLVSAEENLLLAELARRGLGLLYAPGLVVYHHRRKTLAGFASQTFKCGAGRSQMTRLAPSTFSPVFALPSALLLFMLASPFLPRGLAELVLGAYAAAAAVQASSYGLRGGGLDGALLVFVLAPAAHLCYGAGLLIGVLLMYPRKKERDSAGRRDLLSRGAFGRLQKLLP